jgi:drug/metabolite transporter (DMT)-like permease
MTIGGIGFGLGTYLILKAQVLSDPVIVSIVVVSTPAIATGLEVLLDKRRLKKVFVSGVTLAILGGAIAVWDNSRVETVGLGAFVAFVACIFFAWGSRAAVKMLPDLTLTGQTSITAIGAFVFSVSISIFGYLLGHQKIPTSINIIETLPELLIYSIFAFTISQLLWIGGIRKVGIAVASIHFNFVPFYVMFSLVLLGGSWSWVSVIGTAVVVAGVLLANRKT